MQHLPEEVVAVLFAYYSRSRDSLRRNLLKLVCQGDLDLLGQRPAMPKARADLTHARDKARQFHEKWVVGYGHASVAEHAVVHLAIENVSIIAGKVVEDMRLASFTEKSTRCVQNVQPATRTRRVGCIRLISNAREADDSSQSP